MQIHKQQICQILVCEFKAKNIYYRNRYGREISETSIGRNDLQLI